MILLDTHAWVWHTPLVYYRSTSGHFATFSRGLRSLASRWHTIRPTVVK
jgi:hypothetical protein